MKGNSMNIKKYLCRLREILIYTFKEIPVMFLIEIWTLVRVVSISITVGFIIVDSYLRNNLDSCILTFFK
jgi:hypothetical protein